MRKLYVRMLFHDFFNMLHEESVETIPNPDYKEPHPICSKADMSQKFCGHCGIENKMVEYPKTITRTSWTHERTKWSDKNDALKDFLTRLYKMESKTIKYKGVDIDLDFDCSYGNKSYTLQFLASSYYHCDRCYRDPEETIAKLRMSDLYNTYVYLECFELDYLPTINNFEECQTAMEQFQAIGLENIEYHDIERFVHNGCFY